MGRPLKIKKSTTKDIGFNPYNLLDQPTVVIPTGLSSTEFTGVVGGAETGVATTAYPVIAITAYITGGAAEDAAYIITQKGQTKYLVAVEVDIQDEDIVAGNTYVITSVGNTNWAALGAGVNATAGDIFTAKVSGAGLGTTGVVYQVGVCSLVDIAAGGLAEGEMQMTVDIGAGPIQVSRVNNKYVWDYSVPPVKYLANFFDAGNTAAASGAQVSTWTNTTGLYTLGEVSNYTS